MPTSRPLTDRQVAALKRIAMNGDGYAYVAPDVARQLARRGLVTITGRMRQRKEWNRPVKGSTLWHVRLN